ncbi:hypothetical protein [Streptomyces qinglanensis]|uniref:Mce-associated membrane protein n=1 Tax=Streptomyces qinglanensis TaxID=943816 RepID=A0A1H9THQ2_9ACTN|nr:hypothetical protein SAMN05421870_106149 [Streptomyces qinglanensis]
MTTEVSGREPTPRTEPGPEKETGGREEPATGTQSMPEEESGGEAARSAEEEPARGAEAASTATPAAAPDAAGEAAQPLGPAGQRPVWPAALLVAALLFCAISGWIYWRADTDDDLAYSRARDRALAAGRAHLATLNSVDAAHVEADLREWRRAATGPLRDELRRSEKKSAKTLRERGGTVRAEVTDAALTGLDDTAGTATLIATLRIRTATRSGTPATDRKRMRAGLERTEQGWKLTSVTPVAVGEES